MITDSIVRLSELGYELSYIKEDGIEPETVEEKFSNFSTFSKLREKDLEISNKKLYFHQYKAFKELAKGNNIILKSGTGSGKTEAWLLYTLEYKKKTLVIYPTLALANDQIRRLTEYSKHIGFRIEAIDAKRKLEARSRGITLSKLRSRLSQADIVISNPAFLLTDLKRWASDTRSCVLMNFLHKIDMVIIDELDFYGPREISLLLAILRILNLIVGRKYQVSILTATLGNPKELGDLLTEINGFPTSIIDGKPFRVPNNTIIVLGKNLKNIWNIFRKKKDLILSVPGISKDIKEAVDNFEVFKNNVYKIIQIARSLQIDIPNIYIDPIEILQSYIDDEGVTIVFTRSIARAEELARKLRLVLTDDEKNKVASHHHLVSKSYREEVESMARRGKVKIIFSPRTLSQGIDIGTIIRIVHLGLPDDVREYHQREGRKGRRKEILFTESIIIPSSSWDRELLSRGVDVLKEWINLPLENVIINKDNKYGLLFLSLFKHVSGRFQLNKNEITLLKKLNLLEGNSLNVQGKKVWYKLNFYEFAPPYGIKRIKIYNGKEKYLEDISFVDLTEKFQAGSFDYTSDSIVVGYRFGGKQGKIVTGIVEKPISERVLWENEATSYAYEEYIKIKTRWGESVNLFLDYVHGRIHSEVICSVYPPRRGFGKYIEIPNRVRWILLGNKVRLYSYGEKTFFVHERRSIEVPSLTYGKYEDYTYGKTIELESRENIEFIRIGMAFIILLLRLVYNYSLKIFSYDIGNIGDKKFLTLWEESCAGLIEKIDWISLKDKIKSFSPSGLCDVIIRAIDEDAYYSLVNLGMRWDIAKDYAYKIIDYLLLEDRLKLKVKEKEIYIPKPSKALKNVTIEILEEPLADDSSVSLIFLGLFDGEDIIITRAIKEFYSLKLEDKNFESKILELVNKDFNFVVWDKEVFYDELNNIGLKSIVYLFKALEKEKKIIDIRTRMKKIFNIQSVSFEEVLRGLSLPLKVSVYDIRREYENTRRKIKNLPYSKWLMYTRFLTQKSKEYMVDFLEKLYSLYLITEEFRDDKNLFS
ncbi:MAG: DEAD/DEAH box helicase [Thermoproteales archaeon]|nr:DEAD/DEAH box helicase [Thermoproteales archaeon]